MFKRCKHKFIKEKNNIYCENCGKYKRMECDHEWKDTGRYSITNHYNKQQEVLNRTCKICGKMMQINLTTGEII